MKTFINTFTEGEAAIFFTIQFSSVCCKPKQVQLLG